MKKLELFIIFSIAIVIIFFRFNQIPKNLASDEVEFAKLSLSLSKNSYLPYSQMATGHATLYFYILLLSFTIFGISNFALRFPSAFFGIINGLIFYSIINKTTTKKRLSFLLSLIFLTLHWYFNFARFSFEATFLLFLELTTIYFLFEYLKTQKNQFVVLTGLFSGFAFNSYTPGRIFFLLPLFFLLTKSLKKSFFIFLFVFIVTILPLSLYFLNNNDNRFEKQLFLKNNDLSLFKKGEFLLTNIKNSALMFVLKGDTNGKHNYPGKPALNPILGILFIIGLVLTIKKYNSFNNQFFILYFVISIIPSILTYPWENPNMLRTFTIIPSVVYFIGNTINFLFNIKAYRRYFIVITLILITMSSFYEIRTYFKYQAKVFKNAFEVKEKLEEKVSQRNHRTRPNL